MRDQHSHPSTPRSAARRRRFRGYLVAATLLAALIPITAAIGVNTADAITPRLLVAFAIPLLAGLAVYASAAATNTAAGTPRRERRTPH